MTLTAPLPLWDQMLQRCSLKYQVNNYNYTLADNEGYIEANMQRKLRVGGVDGPAKVESFKEMTISMGHNMHGFQLSIFKKLFDIIMKKNREENSQDMAVQTDLSENESSNKSANLFRRTQAEVRRKH